MVTDIQLLVDYVRIVFSLLLMTVLSIQDLKSREVSSTLVYTYLCISVFVFVISTLLSELSIELRLFYFIVTMSITTGVLSLLYFYGLVGDGDVYVASAVGLCFTYPDAYKTTLTRQGVLPPSLVILLYSTMASILLSFINLLANLSRHREELEGIPLQYRILLPLVAFPIKIEDYLSGRYKYVYPIQIFEIDETGNVKTCFRLLVNLDKEYKNHIKDLVARGLLKGDQHLWVTYGLPMILFINIGLIAFLVLGDKPLLHLLRLIVGSPL